MDITFHYPPELLQILVDTLPKLCKSKSDLLLFFQGAGTPKLMLEPYHQLLKTNKSSFNKYHVTRELLAKVNEQGEAGLRVRRELLKRHSPWFDGPLYSQLVRPMGGRSITPAMSLAVKRAKSSVATFLFCSVLLRRIVAHVREGGKKGKT